MARGFVAAEVGARLVHLPYRSQSQIKTKIVNGGSAYEVTDLDKKLGGHWRRLRKIFSIRQRGPGATNDYVLSTNHPQGSMASAIPFPG